MAATKIWPVRDRFDKVLDYASNAQKTDADIEKYHALDGVIERGEHVRNNLKRIEQEKFRGEFIARKAKKKEEKNK